MVLAVYVADWSLPALRTMIDIRILIIQNVSPIRVGSMKVKVEYEGDEQLY